MKKTISAVCLLIAAVMLFGVFGVLGVSADEPTLTKKDITTYVFSLESVKTTSCVFRSDLPEVPYIDPVDYLSTIFVDEFSQSKNEDGTFTVTAPHGEMIANVSKNTLSFESFEEFSQNVMNREGSSVSISFITSNDSEILGEERELVLDLGSYGIDIIEYEGKLYLPLPTIAVIFSSTYSNAEYVGGCIYYLHSMEDMSVDGYFDKSPIYSSLERTQEMARFTYANFCFAIDRFYGQPSNALIGEEIAAKGIDATLDTYDDFTLLAKQGLQSQNVCEYLSALCILAYYFNDGGHTVMYSDPLGDATHYPESVLFTTFLDKMKNSDEQIYVAGKQMYLQVASTMAGREPFQSAHTQAYAAYEKVVVWNETVYLAVSGDTAVFVFDSFDADTAHQFKEALDYAAAHGLKNFIIDVSANGGGLVAATYFMMASMLSKKTGSNEFVTYSQNVTTGTVHSTTVRLDLNFDGVIDDADKEVAYDFNFAVLTSCYSFSSGNLLPVYAKEAGIPVLGQTSGGGACTIQKMYLPDAHFFFVSSNSKFVVPSGADVDKGAPVNYDLTAIGEDGEIDYSGLYDIDRVGDLVEGYYADQTVDAGVDDSPALILFAALCIAAAAAYTLFRKRRSAQAD